MKVTYGDTKLTGKWCIVERDGKLTQVQFLKHQGIIDIIIISRFNTLRKRFNVTLYQLCPTKHSKV